MSSPTKAYAKIADGNTFCDVTGDKVCSYISDSSGGWAAGKVRIKPEQQSAWNLAFPWSASVLARPLVANLLGRLDAALPIALASSFGDGVPLNTQVVVDDHRILVRGVVRSVPFEAFALLSPATITHW